MKTRADKVYQSFIEHELIKKKYKLDTARIPELYGAESSEKIVETIRLLIKEVDKGANKTDKEIIEYITRSLNA